MHARAVEVIPTKKDRMINLSKAADRPRRARAVSSDFVGGSWL
jgi:hypothetical protein